MTRIYNDPNMDDTEYEIPAGVRGWFTPVYKSTDIQVETLNVMTEFKTQSSHRFTVDEIRVDAGLNYLPTINGGRDALAQWYYNKNFYVFRMAHPKKAEYDLLVVFHTSHVYRTVKGLVRTDARMRMSDKQNAALLKIYQATVDRENHALNWLSAKELQIAPNTLESLALDESQLGEGQFTTPTQLGRALVLKRIIDGVVKYRATRKLADRINMRWI